MQTEPENLVDLGLSYRMTTPCADCPFRNDKPFHLRRGRAEQIIDSMLHENATFPCHKTTTFDESGNVVRIGNEIHCAGILILLAKTNHLWDSMATRIAAMLGVFKPEALHLTAPVYNTISDFIEGVSFGERNGRQNKARKKPRTIGRTG